MNRTTVGSAEFGTMPALIAWIKIATWRMGTADVEITSTMLTNAEDRGIKPTLLANAADVEIKPSLLTNAADVEIKPSLLTNAANNRN